MRSARIMSNTKGYCSVILVMIISLYENMCSTREEDIMNSFISWIGGKNYLKRAIYRRIPRDISSYIEAFGGAAWVLF